MKLSYERQINGPPAPFLPVQLSFPGQPDRAQDVIAKVDTGADVSAIPAHLIRSLELRVVGSLLVSGFDGHAQTVESYAVRIEFPTEKPIFLTVLAMDDPYALLGRDALNQFRLLLDGPALTLEILPFEGDSQASVTR